MKKATAIAAALALALALAGCSMIAKPESKSTMAASDASMSASSSSSSSAEVKWTDAASADAAAKGAGFEKFGVMEKIVVGDLEFKNPRFSYAGGVAQADYETGAAAVIVRKADGKHTATLTDADTAEFAEKWTKSYEGLNVTLYGAARGAATVFTWTDGTQEFGVTFQGLGGEELSMDSDDVAAIVKGFHEANATDAKAASSSSTASNGGTDNPLTEADIENLVYQNGLGAFGSAQLFQGSDGHWYWSVVTRDTANEPHTWTVDAAGNFTSADSAASGNSGVDNNLTEADVQQIVFNQGLGAYRYASLIEGDDGVWYWQVCVGDIYNNDHFLLVDPYGNVTEQG